jgi:glycosyltransferase involved in cell wall biosynthesis
MKKLVIIQTTTPSYRSKFYSYLHKELQSNFKLYSGDFYFEKSVVTDDSFEQRIKINNFFFLRRKFLFQTGIWGSALSSDLLVLEMNPRIISNWIILLLRKILLRKTILWGHAWPRAGKQKKTDVIRNLMRSLGDEIIVYTRTQKKELQERMKAKNIFAACNAVFFKDEMKTKSLLQTTGNLIYVGRLTTKKKPLFLVRTFGQMVSKLPEDILLLIIGTGPEKEKIEQYVTEKNLHNRIKILGHIDDYHELKKLYETALFSVSPGYVGLSITQSFGFGVPMIISKDENHSPEIEAAQREINAVLFETDSTASLQKEIMNIYHNRESWITKRQAIAKECQDQYSIEIMAAPFLKIFEKYNS